jgi:NAD-dependent dihydropyrimidine dehydrogenase PreA subunit
MDKDGIPTKETLDSLGLEYVSEDFLRRGILTGNESTPSKETPAQKDEELKSGGALTLKSEVVKKVVKTIKVNLDKCNGCRACEMACSAFHAEPKYSSINPPGHGSAWLLIR